MEFLNNEHKEKYYEYIERDKTSDFDVERKSMFYILSSDESIYNRIHSLYDFTDHSILFESYFKIKNLLSSSHSKMVYLAYQLYNNFKLQDFDRKELTITEIFGALDEENFKVCINALNMRFKIE